MRLRSKRVRRTVVKDHRIKMPIKTSDNGNAVHATRLTILRPVRTCQGAGWGVSE